MLALLWLTLESEQTPNSLKVANTSIKFLPWSLLKKDNVCLHLKVKASIQKYDKSLVHCLEGLAQAVTATTRDHCNALPKILLSESVEHWHWVSKSVSQSRDQLMAVSVLRNLQRASNFKEPRISLTSVEVFDF